ncbi:tetratricopeptide repeat protein [Phaeovulum sp.]|uniref:tetratricopeptide repeat protein n=1 Tax=Phaeovulum sp. TaxID=2934796 RepID=UPI00356AF570
MPRFADRFLPALLALCLATSPQSATAQASVDFAGPFLAARAAESAGDFAAAAKYSLLALNADPENLFLQEDALLSQVAMGNMETALPLAKSMQAEAHGSQIASLVLLADAAARADYAGVQALVAAGTNTGPLLDGLIQSWAYVGSGQVGAALEGFDALIANDSYAAFGLYHKALALASVGDFEGADAILSGAEAGPLQATRRMVIAQLQVLSQLDRNADALEMILALFGPDPDPELAALRARLEAGETLRFTQIESAQDGLAEVFSSVGAALGAENTDIYALSYARLALHMRPDVSDTVLLVAGLLEALNQPALASTVYAQISRDDPAYVAAEAGRAAALFAADQSDEAVAALVALSSEYPEIAAIWSKLGDMQRRLQQFEDAAVSYDKALALLGEPQPDQWFLYYARGMANERAGNWAGAEADFREALNLSPDQPQVLNYLGYSYVDRNENLDEALAMIERAVAAVPEDGAIVDSLGWALYRLGRYEEAVAPMEKATQLMPVDSLINDHLGDVYWAVGRQREAEFQWRRALSFEPDTEAEAERIRRKLEVGLDAVLAEEGAPPLRAVTAANGN